MDFTNVLHEVVEVYLDDPSLDTTSDRGVVMLLADTYEEEVQFFTWYSDNVFAHEPVIGDACPENEYVTWLQAQPKRPQVTLWQVDDPAEQVYACGANRTSVTSIGRVVLNILGPSNSSMEGSSTEESIMQDSSIKDSGTGGPGSNATVVVSGTNHTQTP